MRLVNMAESEILQGGGPQSVVGCGFIGAGVGLAFWNPLAAIGGFSACMAIVNHFKR